MNPPLGMIIGVAQVNKVAPLADAVTSSVGSALRLATAPLPTPPSSLS